MNDSMNAWNEHTFVLCAYKESPYLEECAKSLSQQTTGSQIIIATATPNNHIKSISEQYGFPLHIHDAKPGIASDWNYAIDRAQTAFVTIAHQDDVYAPTYLEHAQRAIEASARPLIFFTNYGELRNGEEVNDNQLLSVKRRLLSPLQGGAHASSRFIRKRILSLGSVICCPSVTLALENIAKPVFSEGMKSNLDWEAWAHIANLEGDFLYDSEILMHHRIHEDSETSAIIGNNLRTKEDLAMFEQFWPKPIARVISHVYSRGEKSNEI